MQALKEFVEQTTSKDLFTYLYVLETMGGPRLHSPATCDEVEYALWHNHGIRVIKKTLAQLKRDATLDEHGKLMLGAFEASPFFSKVD